MIIYFRHVVFFPVQKLSNLVSLIFAHSIVIPPFRNIVELHEIFGFLRFSCSSLATIQNLFRFLNNWSIHFQIYLGIKGTPPFINAFTLKIIMGFENVFSKLILRFKVAHFVKIGFIMWFLRRKIVIKIVADCFSTWCIYTASLSYVSIETRLVHF